MLIVCNIALLSAQENTSPSFASYTTSTDPVSFNGASNAPLVRKAVATKKTYFRLGEKVVSLAKLSTADELPFIIVSLHSNEYTATEAARKFITEYGGTYIELLNNNERNIEFSLFEKKMSVDPNKIFTPRGRWNDLAANQKTDHIISQQITEFASFILNEIPVDKTIVSLHNNKEGDYSMNDYIKGGDFFKNARLVYQNPALSVNDFIITTDKVVFEKLKEKKLNVVFQNYQVKDDGSLGVFCAKTKRAYIGIETQIGHFNEQENMLRAVADILK
jgi:hypothetical protein